MVIIITIPINTRCHRSVITQPLLTVNNKKSHLKVEWNMFELLNESRHLILNVLINFNISPSKGLFGFLLFQQKKSYQNRQLHILLLCFISLSTLKTLIYRSAEGAIIKCRKFNSRSSVIVIGARIQQKPMLIMIVFLYVSFSFLCHLNQIVFLFLCVIVFPCTSKFQFSILRWEFISTVNLNSSQAHLDLLTGELCPNWHNTDIYSSRTGIATHTKEKYSSRDANCVTLRSVCIIHVT